MVMDSRFHGNDVKKDLLYSPELRKKAMAKAIAFNTLEIPKSN